MLIVNSGFGEVAETLPIDGFCLGRNYLVFVKIDGTLECSSFPHPEARSNASLSRLLPLPRTIGASGCPGGLARGSDISVLSPVPEEGSGFLA
jgi:hypothetical protein